MPGGSSIRRGAYLAPGVVCMPPMYVNVGAYVDSGTMVDSHALVGSCAQIGKRVHLSAAAQIGGVLEPVNAVAGRHRGRRARRRQLRRLRRHDRAHARCCGAGVILTRGTPVFDLVRETVLPGSADAPLEIPQVPSSFRVRVP